MPQSAIWVCNFVDNIIFFVEYKSFFKSNLSYKKGDIFRFYLMDAFCLPFKKLYIIRLSELEQVCIIHFWHIESQGELRKWLNSWVLLITLLRYADCVCFLCCSPRFLNFSTAILLGQFVLSCGCFPVHCGYLKIQLPPFQEHPIPNMNIEIFLNNPKRAELI